MNKFEELEEQNLKHVIKESGVYFKNTEGDFCEFVTEYFVDKDCTEKEINDYHSLYEKCINETLEKFILNDEKNEILDLRFLNNMSDKVTFE